MLVAASRFKLRCWLNQVAGLAVLKRRPLPSPACVVAAAAAGAANPRGMLHLVELLSRYHTVLLLLRMELNIHRFQLLFIEIYQPGHLCASDYIDLGRQSWPRDPAANLSEH